MYSLSQFRRGMKKGMTNPSFFARECNRLYHRRFYSQDCNTDGVDIIDEDWDNLLILDACRYDMFAEQCDFPGRLEQRQSKGSHTTEFLQGNFDGETLHDTVYVTASPQLYRWKETIDVQFHEVVNVWQEDGWDDTHGTVLPETMTQYVQDAADRYPHKRIIGHFLQPHYPFIGADRELNTRTFGDEQQGIDIWGELSRGQLDCSTTDVWDAYRQNLELVRPKIHELLLELPGRTVVTADHGNMVEERSSPIPIVEWGHPPGVYTEELVAVPWHVYENGPRKRITSEANESAADTLTDDVVENRLQNLGYVE